MKPFSFSYCLKTLKRSSGNKSCRTFSKRLESFYRKLPEDFQACKIHRDIHSAGISQFQYLRIVV